MIFPSLGVSRYVDIYCRNKEISQNSVLAVGINRKEIARIVQGQPVQVRTFSSKLGLSKSRYYRWINYDVDLPLEYVFGIKKILGMSNQEFLEHLKPSTEEIINTLSLAAYYSFYEDDDDGFDRIFSSMRKYDGTPFLKELPHYCILNYIKAVSYISNNKDPSPFITNIDEYLTQIETITTYDIFIKILSMHLKLTKSFSPPLTDIEIYSDKIIEKIGTTNLVDLNIFLGFIVDVSITEYLCNTRSNSLIFLKHIQGSLTTQEKSSNSYFNFFVTELEEFLNSGNLDVFMNNAMSHSFFFNSDLLYWKKLQDIFTK